MRGIFGIYHKSLLEISRELCNLHYTHILVGAELNQIKTVEQTKTPCVPIYVVDGFSRMSVVPDNAIAILVECKTILDRSNCDKLLQPGLKLKQALRKMLQQVRHEPIQNIQFSFEPIGLQEIIEKATSYSFLNDIQTAIYKINPYDFRKKIQHTIISYFYGMTSRNAISNVFKQHASKLQGLKDKCLSKEGNRFRSAISEYLACGDENKVSQETGFATFEILYIVKSYEKEAEIAERIRLGLPVAKAGRKPKKVDPIMEKLRKVKLPNMRKHRAGK